MMLDAGARQFCRRATRALCAVVLVAIVAPVSRADAPPAADRYAAARTHWAFQPIRKVAPPESNDPWCISDIDRFVLAKLKEKDLKPAPPAKKATLIRRATFDLIGLPPTPGETSDFEKDDRPDAFARVVDRLLASPHYGERWGRYWLDLARYADDEGNSFLTPTPGAYLYRDWVIRALNRDMPYNQFLRLQLAGDLIPEPTTDYVERLGGLGFQGLGPKFRKGAAGEAKAKADELEDRVDTVSRGLMSLTVSCARCHDHKFDPIPTRDYYSMAAAYNGATWSDRSLGSPEAVAQAAAREAAANTQKEKVDEWPAERGKLLGRQELSRLDAYLVAAWEVRAQRKKKLNPDPAALAKQANLQPFFLKRLVDWLGSNKAMQVLGTWCSSADQAAAATQPADAAGLEMPADLRETTARLGTDVRAVLDPPAMDPSAAAKDRPATQPAVPNPAGPALLKALWQEPDAPFAVPAGDVMALLSDADRKDLDEQKAELARLQATSPTDPPKSPSVNGGGEPMHVYVRGNPEQLGDAAPPRFLSILQPGGMPPVNSTPAGTPASGATSSDARSSQDHFTRLDLADAIISPTNPLTARVFVNRVWSYHFGRGIVASLGNFGTRGDLPTHPELLDTLSARFIESGWSIKWLHRQIMLSSTYQLSGASDPANLAKDADNHYLWRFAPRRLDVEAWRDAMLAVSGKLDPAMGGPSLDVKEPGEKAPGFPAFIRLRGLMADDPNNGHRTVYCVVSRYAPTLTLTMFDFPEPNVASDHRNVTTIPQQQLFVLNSPFMLAMSKAFAARLAAVSPSDDTRMQLAWQIAYGRAITPPETARCVAFLQIATDPGDKLTPWEQLCQAVLCTNEFAFVR